MMPNLRPTIQSVLTVSLLAVALYVMVIHASGAETQKWAESALTFMMGYWLRGR
jgi:hypothetical protein